jgi:hypothetical protein
MENQSVFNTILIILSVIFAVGNIIFFIALVTFTEIDSKGAEENEQNTSKTEEGE